jgi:hypothetical protein
MVVAWYVPFGARILRRLQRSPGGATEERNFLDSEHVCSTMRQKDWVLFMLYASGVAIAMGLMAIF